MFKELAKAGILKQGSVLQFFFKTYWSVHSTRGHREQAGINRGGEADFEHTDTWTHGHTDTWTHGRRNTLHWHRRIIPSTHAELQESDSWECFSTASCRAESRVFPWAGRHGQDTGHPRRSCGKGQASAVPAFSQRGIAVVLCCQRN